jgi:hypothetical protein
MYPVVSFSRLQRISEITDTLSSLLFLYNEGFLYIRFGATDPEGKIGGEYPVRINRDNRTAHLRAIEVCLFVA